MGMTKALHNKYSIAPLVELVKKKRRFFAVPARGLVSPANPVGVWSWIQAGAGPGEISRSESPDAKPRRFCVRVNRARDWRGGA
jgi:hypothetical protein